MVNNLSLIIINRNIIWTKSLRDCVAKGWTRVISWTSSSRTIYCVITCVTIDALKIMCKIL